MTTPTQQVLIDIVAERDRQNRKWGEQNHPDGTGPLSAPFDLYPDARGYPLQSLPAQKLADVATALCGTAAQYGGVTWTLILLEEVFEALAEDDPERLRVELVQVAAVAAQWAEALDRRLMDEVHASRSSRRGERADVLDAEARS